MEPIFLKIELPPGSLKKTTTVKVNPKSTIEQAILEITKSGGFRNPDEFLLYNKENHGNRKWLDKNKTLADYSMIQSKVLLQQIFEYLNLLTHMF